MLILELFLHLLDRLFLLSCNIPHLWLVHPLCKVSWLYVTKRKHDIAWRLQLLIEAERVDIYFAEAFGSSGWDVIPDDQSLGAVADFLIRKQQCACFKFDGLLGIGLDAKFDLLQIFSTDAGDPKLAVVHFIVKIVLFLYGI